MGRGAGRPQGQKTQPGLPQGASGPRSPLGDPRVDQQWIDPSSTSPGHPHAHGWSYIPLQKQQNYNNHTFRGLSAKHNTNMEMF